MCHQIRAARNRYELLSLGLCVCAFHDVNCDAGFEGQIKLIWDHEGDAILNHDDSEINRSYRKLSGNHIRVRVRFRVGVRVRVRVRVL
jgi:hypothetical protein